MISRPTAKAEARARVAGLQGERRKPDPLSPGAEVGPATSGRTKSEDHLLTERVVERSNMRLAYQRVVRNKGAPGVDDVTVAEFGDWLKVHWPSVKKALLEGSYLPRPVAELEPDPYGPDFPGLQRRLLTKQPAAVPRGVLSANPSFHGGLLSS